jgi:predicted O-linked N-acetylglucosamine transferase (SPINDLY family)/glycosyltransferase involved in cell wall biosynthesis
MNKPEKVLSFSPYAYWQLHALYEVAICHNLQWRGHTYNYVSCDGLFSDCDMFWESTVGSRPANACTVCQSQVKSLLEGCHIPNTWLGRYKTPDDINTARSFAHNLRDDELLDAVFNGYPVGAWVKSSVHSHLRINTVDLSNPKHCSTLRSYVYSGAIALTCMNRLLDDLQPTIMLLFNGRMSVTRIAMELARERGIRVVCHERGLAKETLLLWENESCLALRPYAELSSEWGEIPLSEREVAQVTQWLTDRAQGANLNWKAFSVQSSLGVVEGFLAANQGKKIWSLFTSSMDEIVAEPEYSSVFVTQYRWIEETVAFARLNPSIALVIRVHPNSGGKKSTGRNTEELSFFQELQTTLPANVALVMPDDKVSSYALIDRTDLGLVYGSTVALEMACRGKKVLLAARTAWMSCRSIELLTDLENYASLLASHAVKTLDARETEQIAIAAYRFAYAYVHRWNIPFPLVSMPDIHNGVLTARTLDEFKPGVHDCLDYCAEIVLGVRPSIPVVIKPAPIGAAEKEIVALRSALKTLAGEPPEPTAPRFSVVITCYNYGKYLRECVRSVANQTFRNFELIIVNDGSTDDSLAVAEACLKEFSALKITIVDQPNSGQPALSRNAGITRAKGEFILPIDADDRIAANYLEEAFKAIDADPKVDLVYSDSLFDNGKSRSRKKPGRFDVKSLSACNQLVYCCVYRRRVWEKIGGYRDNVRGYEDWDFWIAASLTGATAAYIPSVGLLYNEKDSGVYSQTVAHHNARFARVMLNNPTAYSSAQLQQAKAVLAGLAQPKPAALVSVVIPCFNQAQFLGEAVESVIAQSYKNWEIIIVNDGSPDNTSQVAQSLILGQPGHRIRLIEKQNGGLSDARNAGIRFAQGEYILPLDADDMIDPSFLAKTVALLDQNPAVGIAYTDWVYFGAYRAKRDAIDYDFTRLCTKENLFTCTSLYRKKAWEATGGYNSNMTRGVEDWDFWIGCGEKGFTGQRIAEPLFFYRAKDQSMIHTLQPHLKAMFARIILNHSKLYNPEAVESAQKIFDAANLPPAKPGSLGTEWMPPVSTLAQFQKIMTDAGELVRENRTAEALVIVEQAARLAPTPECAARAEEILGMLRSAAPAASVAPTAHADPSDELFGPDEVRNVEQMIATYGDNPADPVREQLLDLQQGLMNFLVTAEPEKLEGQFQGGFGRVFRALAKSGLPSEPPTEEARVQCAILDEALASPGKPAESFDFRPLLARMLRVPAHRGNVSIAPEKIPAWLLDDYLAYVLHAPQVFVTDGEAEEFHTHLLGWARAILQRTRTAPNEKLTMSVAHFFAMKANCIPLYFSNRNTREVAEKRAAIMEFVLLKNGAVIDAKVPKRLKNRTKIKVGYLSAHFGAQTETHVTLPTLQLDRSKFEICLFPLASVGGPIEERCRSFADSFTPLPQNVHQQVKAIREAALDVIIIGTNVTAVTNAVSLIALHRLAPLQLVSYCSPVSTGMRHIDGYLTGTFNDFPGLQDHFSEKLQFCEGPPGCLDYTVEAKASAGGFSRESLGIAPDEIVFVNAAACFKILPEMQETWAKLLKSVPKSRLILLPFNPNWSNAFPVKQFERTLTEACARHGVGRDRFILAGSLPSRADVKSLESVADVYLDTFPFSGSISVIDPLELGIPTVVWAAETHRSRMAAALLRELEIPELIAENEAEYIALAVRLATDTACRREFVGRIRAAMARGPKFVNPTAYAVGLGRLLESLVDGGIRRGLPSTLPKAELAHA